jgi:hypothetical protein
MAMRIIYKIRRVSQSFASTGTARHGCRATLTAERRSRSAPPWMATAPPRFEVLGIAQRS